MSSIVPFAQLGTSGLKVSVLCLGCMNFGESTSEEDSLEILRLAHETGVTFWDTANVYSDGGSESILGKAFWGKPLKHLVFATISFWRLR